MPPLQERRFDLDVSPVRGAVIEEVRVHLPASIQVTGLPDPVVLEIPEASYRFSVRTEGDVLVFSKELIIDAFEIPVERCAAFAEFLAEASRNELSMVILNVGSGDTVLESIASTK